MPDFGMNDGDAFEERWALRGHRYALLDLFEAVFAGGSFEDLHGSLVRPGASVPDALGARFALNENAGTTASDGSGHSQ